MKEILKKCSWWEQNKMQSSKQSCQAIVFLVAMAQVWKSMTPTNSYWHNPDLGKTVLLQANIQRTVKRIVDDSEPINDHLMIICVWQPGAKALYEEYRALAANLPKANNLEVIVVSRDELMEKYHATLHKNEATTLQMNRVCQNISTLVQNKTVHLFVDECWITVPKKLSPHMTQVVSFLNYHIHNILLLLGWS